MKKLIVNADDFGYSEEINRGIIYSYQNGIVTSTSLLVNGKFAEAAVKLAKENSNLEVGLHLDLDKFFNIEQERGIVSGLKNPEQKIEELKEEAKNQIEKYLSFSLPCDHLDCHHHLNMYPFVLPGICEIASQYKFRYLRFFRKFYSNQAEFEKMKKILETYNLKYTPHFIEGWYWGNVDEPFEVAELMTHPGYGEYWRELELARCCNCELKTYLDNNNIKLTKFKEI